MISMKRLSNSGGLHFILCCIMILPAGSLSHKKTKISGKMTFNPSKEEVQFFIEPLADKKIFSNDQCYNTDCKFTMNVHPDPKSANKATAHYDIDIYRIRPDFSGKIIPCKVMKGIKQRIPFTTIGIAKCDTNKAVTLYPQITEDGLDIAIYGWFMEKSNNVELDKKDHTTLCIPKYQKKYNTMLFGSASFRGTLECSFYFKKKKIKSTIETKYETKTFREYKLSIPADTAHVGLYTFNCIAKYKSKMDLRTVTVRKGSAVKVQQISNHRILMRSGFVVPVEQTKLVIKFRVFSSFKIAKVTVEKVEGKGPQNIIVKYISHSTWISRYEVIFPQLSMEMDGEYALVAEATSGNKTPKKVFKLTISQAPQVNVVPEKNVVGLGKDASFDCVATGHGLKGIKWEMEGNEKLGPTAKTETLETKDNSLALHLSFSSPRYEDSGWYICTAWTQYKNHKSTKQVELLVFPPGSPFIDPNYTPPDQDEEDDGEISEDEIYKEFEEQENDNKHVTYWKERLLKHKKILVIVAGCCFVAIIMIVLVIICVVVKCCKRNRSAVHKTDQHQPVDEEEYKNENKEDEISTIKDEDETKQDDEGRLLDDYSSPDGSDKEEITPRQEKKKKRSKKRKVKKPKKGKLD